MKIDVVRPSLGGGRKVYMETYGCQMNVGDTEIVLAILLAEGFERTDAVGLADVIFINTCSVRDNAEQRVWGRLSEFRRYKKAKPELIVGVLGCMAERLREQLMEKEQIVDIVAGPDSYRELPLLLRQASAGNRGVNVELSREETYAEITPVRTDRNGVGAFISIMRGCNNFCTYCVVPYTRGRERSRDPQTILSEARGLYAQGYREITLLGQNVNSYHWRTEEGEFDFPDLLEAVAKTDPLLRVRFATSHPKDLSDKLIDVMARNANICRAIHLPAQSGSTEMLRRMNRGYTREGYLDRLRAIRERMPDCAVTTDLIAGFCGETQQEHADTLTLMEAARYDYAFMFKYSERPDTKAAKTLADDVPEDVKTARLNEIIGLQNRLSLESNRADVGKTFEVLVEGSSKKSEARMSGRTSQNKVVVFDGNGCAAGDYVRVRITDCTSATLLGEVVD